MTSAGDWLNLVWALKSFTRHPGRATSFIHDDGTLPADALGAIMPTHFQPVWHHPARRGGCADGARIWRTYPQTAAIPPHQCAGAQGVLDFAAYLESDRMLLLDSDILFFSEPTEFLRRLEDPSYAVNTFNSDCDDAYAW